MEVLQTVPILRSFDEALMELTDPFGNRLRFNEDLK
jgi:hypothetical protein